MLYHRAISSVLLVWAGLAGPCAAHNHDAATLRKIEVAPFEAVEIAADLEVVIRQQPEFSVQLSGPQSLLEQVVVHGQENTLRVSYSQGMLAKTRKPLKLHIGLPQLQALAVSRTGEVKLAGPFTADHLSVSLTGSAEWDAKDLTVRNLHLWAANRSSADLERLSADLVQVSAADQAQVELSGLATQAVLENKGSGKLDADDLRAHSAVVRVRGKGNVEVSAYETLTASAFGKGTIYYKGSPVHMHREGNLQKIQPDPED